MKPNQTKPRAGAEAERTYSPAGLAWKAYQESKEYAAMRVRWAGVPALALCVCFIAGYEAAERESRNAE